MVFQYIKGLARIDKNLSLYVVSATVALLYLLLGMYAMLDTIYVLFLAVSLLFLFSSEQSQRLIRYSSHYFIYYFSTRGIFFILMCFHVYRGEALPKIITAHINIFDSWVIVTALFLFILLFYWQIVTKGLVRYGEIVARFYLDALPGQQNSIDSEKRDGIISSKNASVERKRILEKSVQLGSLDAGMKLTVGNFFLISLSTMLYLAIRMYVLTGSSTGAVTSEILLQSLAEASVYGFLVTLDAILFLLPLVAALGQAHMENAVTMHPRNRTYKYSITLALFFIFILVYAYASDVIFWEPFLIVSGIFFLLHQYDSNVDANSQSIMLRNKLTSIVMEPVSPEDLKHSPIIEVPLHVIKETSFNTFDDFTELLAKELNQLKHFSFDRLLVKVGLTDALVARYPDGGIAKRVIPQKHVPIDLPIHVMQLLYPKCLTAPHHDSFSLISWIPEKTYIDYYANNEFLAAKVRQLPSVIAEITSSLLKDYQKKLMTTDELFDYIHTTQLEKAESVYSIEILKEAGYRRVLEVSNELNIMGLDGFDIKSIIQSVITDVVSEFKNFVNYKISQDLHYLSAKDAEVRAVMISDKTFDRIGREYSDARDLTRSTLYANTLGKIREMLSILSSRDLSPLLVLLPGTDAEWVSDLFHDLNQEPGRIILLERTFLPKGLKFCPLQSI